MNVYTAQYTFTPLPDWDTYVEKMEKLIAKVKHASGDLLMLPEYAALELFVKEGNSTADHFEKLQSIVSTYCDFFAQMSKKYKLYLQPGTIPVKGDKGFYNRAYFFSPSGEQFYQDKIRLTKFELEAGVFAGGNRLQVIDTPFAKIGIAICYDCEFQDYVNILSQQGVTLLLVPSCTDLAGYYRVHLCCRARAIENQMFVASAVCIGEAKGSLVVEDDSTGRAGIFAPADRPFPDDGVLSLGGLGRFQLVNALLDFNQLADCRKNGAVANFQDLNQTLPSFSQT